MKIFGRKYEKYIFFSTCLLLPMRKCSKETVSSVMSPGVSVDSIGGSCFWTDKGASVESITRKIKKFRNCRKQQRTNVWYLIDSELIYRWISWKKCHKYFRGFFFRNHMFSPLIGCCLSYTRPVPKYVCGRNLQLIRKRINISNTHNINLY